LVIGGYIDQLDRAVVLGCLLTFWRSAGKQLLTDCTAVCMYWHYMDENRFLRRLCVAALLICTLSRGHKQTLKGTEKKTFLACLAFNTTIIGGIAALFKTALFGLLLLHTWAGEHLSS
jgi:hypothetical protein